MTFRAVLSLAVLSLWNCSSEKPFITVAVNDPNAIAGDATEIALYVKDRSADAFDLDDGLPWTLLVVGAGEPGELVALQVDALDLAGEVLGRAHGVAKLGRSPTRRLDLFLREPCAAAADCGHAPTGEISCHDVVCTEGLCEYSLQVGAGCGDPTCANGSLQAAPTCDAIGVCRSPSPAPCNNFACNTQGTACLGPACTASAECLPGFVCDANGNCERPGEANTPCVPAVGCASGLVCIGNQCLIETGSGIACTDNNQCVETCVAGTCQPLADKGQACDTTHDCFSQFHSCVDAVCCTSSCDAECERCDSVNGTAGDCHVSPADEVCSDGSFCNGADRCNDVGVCVAPGINPCAGADQDPSSCAQSCDAVSESCTANDSNRSPCDVGGVICMDGVCTYPPEELTCGNRADDDNDGSTDCDDADCQGRACGAAPLSCVGSSCLFEFPFGYTCDDLNPCGADLECGEMAFPPVFSRPELGESDCGGSCVNGEICKTGMYGLGSLGDHCVRYDPCQFISCGSGNECLVTSQRVAVCEQASLTCNLACAAGERCSLLRSGLPQCEPFPNGCEGTCTASETCVDLAESDQYLTPQCVAKERYCAASFTPPVASSSEVVLIATPRSYTSGVICYHADGTVVENSGSPMICPRGGRFSLICQAGIADPPPVPPSPVLEGLHLDTVTVGLIRLASMGQGPYLRWYVDGILEPNGLEEPAARCGP